jgi:acyl-CoA thioesterase I
MRRNRRAAGRRGVGAARSAALAIIGAAGLACGGRGSPSTAAGSAGSSQSTPRGASVLNGGHRPAPGAASTGRHTLVILGTSLTAGLGLDPDQAYPALLQQHIDSAGLPFTVDNAGLSGETSAGALRRVDWLLRVPIDVLVLETGANDALRGLDVDSTRAHIDSLVRTVARAQPGARICLVQMEAPPNLGPQYTKAFHAMYPAVARAEGITLLPFLLQGVAGRPALNQADGIHPNVKGAQIVAATMWRALEPVLRAEARSQKPEARTADSAASRSLGPRRLASDL